ncbi:MAG: hypothetical protein ACHQHN_00520 [Sphingobacteriales bacterium]
MKRKLFITAALLCTFAVAFAAFADLNGHWTGMLDAPDGNQYPLNYTLKVDGDKLTGTGQGQDGSVAITEGKVKGDSLSFAMDLGGVKVINTGKYFSAGDSISFNLDYQGIKMHSTLKRAADK